MSVGILCIYEKIPPKTLLPSIRLSLAIPIICLYVPIICLIQYSFFMLHCWYLITGIPFVMYSLLSITWKKRKFAIPIIPLSKQINSEMISYFLGKLAFLLWFNNYFNKVLLNCRMSHIKICIVNYVQTNIYSCMKLLQ